MTVNNRKDKLTQRKAIKLIKVGIQNQREKKHFLHIYIFHKGKFQITGFKYAYIKKSIKYFYKHVILCKILPKPIRITHNLII